MIRIIPSEARYTAEHGWLTSRFSFSFAEYYDPANQRFSVLRVFNDDIIQPGSGFDMHPHADMEIMTYVIDGALEHRDSLGNRGVIRAGEVQRMTAGTGIYHAEYNPSPDKPVRLLQLWFFPKERGLAPSWEQRAFRKEDQRNCLLPVVSGHPSGDALSIHQDLTVYLSTLDAGARLVHSQQDGRRMHLFVIEGEVTIDSRHAMKQGDAARITGLSALDIESASGGSIMLIDLP